MEVCRVCKNPEIELLNQLLTLGQMPLSVMAERFNLTADSLSRHRAKHLQNPAAVSSTGVDAQELLLSLQTVRSMAEEVMLGEGNSDLRLRAAREVRQSTEAIASLTGIGKVDPRTALPFWNRLQTGIVKALSPYPEAREAVLLTIEEILGNQ